MEGLGLRELTAGVSPTGVSPVWMMDGINPSGHIVLMIPHDDRRNDDACSVDPEDDAADMPPSPYPTSLVRQVLVHFNPRCIRVRLRHQSLQQTYLLSLPLSHGSVCGGW